VERYPELERLIVPTVTGLGYTFVGLRRSALTGGQSICLYIDKVGGLTLDDCERISRQVGAVLDIEASELSGYTLEVSSPGVDRLLFTLEQFEEHKGKQVSIRLIAPRAGRRNFKGVVQGVERGEICIVVDEKVMYLPFSDINEARLVPEW